MTSSLPNSLLPEAMLSVAGLTDYIQAVLEQDTHLQNVWVVGEVSSTSRRRFGIFFTLQDADGQASIKCVAWNSILKKLVQQPVTGEQLIILGGIRVYAQGGQYQLNVWQALPAGEGLQALRYRQLRQRLEAEGLFASQRKRPLPIHPRIIGVVTSLQAAAWGDIQRTLRQRYPGLHILFSPAQVQGELAAASIVKAIERVERDGRAQLLILSRGGGASEDLVCFNDERVVRAIANCSIPILTGIGHEQNECLADLVADESTHTPTAAAECAVPELMTLYAEHQQRKHTLNKALNRVLDASSRQLQQLNQRLRRLPLQRQLQQEHQAIIWKRQRLIQATSQRLKESKQHCQLLQQKLATLDPNTVLKRGYAVVRAENGAIVRSVDNLILGEEVEIQLGEGKVKAHITELDF